MPGNLPRVLPEGLGVRLDGSSWKPAPLFDLIAERGPVDELEMRRTFNLGVGFVFVISKETAMAAMQTLEALGEHAIALGEVVSVPTETAFEERVIWAAQ